MIEKAINNRLLNWSTTFSIPVSITLGLIAIFTETIWLALLPGVVSLILVAIWIATHLIWRRIKHQNSTKPVQNLSLKVTIELLDVSGSHTARRDQDICICSSEFKTFEVSSTASYYEQTFAESFQFFLTSSNGDQNYTSLSPTLVGNNQDGWKLIQKIDENTPIAPWAHLRKSYRTDPSKILVKTTSNSYEHEPISIENPDFSYNRSYELNLGSDFEGELQIEVRCDEKVKSGLAFEKDFNKPKVFIGTQSNNSFYRLKDDKIGDTYIWKRTVQVTSASSLLVIWPGPVKPLGQL